ncbi:M23 family metallopeptidase [Gracilibacillus alcaliphilus]|uniref:M23 family metallopeptidase n=1 Tax=Gracilibacillus alcaliphilus TaxID=1401441 RepID=UPI00195BFB6C|nr:M23 family metallopeptidase [Gracilibacillus alcaliphilus]MBM7679735.1 stage II sporulation protein Q [Gracilibacillus alcaliphilus]
MEENNNVSKNKWKRIVKKKWFFPALYLMVAAIALTGVLWYQNTLTNTPDLAENAKDHVGDMRHSTDQEESAPVMQQQEVLQLPIAEDVEAEIVTKFYDYGASEEDQQDALILHQNKYYQSDGIALSTSDHEAFDVTASLSGTVAEIKQDPLLGNVIKMEHEEGISTYYASLDEVLVEEGAEVKQGDSIGTAGQSNLGQANGVHVHFEVRKDGTAVNPETFINQPLSKIEAAEKQEAAEEETTETEAEETDETQAEPSEPSQTEENDQSQPDSSDQSEADETDQEEELPSTEEQEEAHQEISFHSMERV